MTAGALAFFAFTKCRDLLTLSLSGKFPFRQAAGGLATFGQIRLFFRS